MICKNCGSVNDDASVFCASCGASLKEQNTGIQKDDEATVYYSDAENNSYFEDNRGDDKKKKVGSFLPLILKIAIPLAVIIVCLSIFWPYITNFAMGFVSPEKHQAFVYKNTAEGVSDMIFGNIMREGKANKGNLTVNAKKDFLEDANMPEGFKNLSVDYEYGIKDIDQSLKVDLVCDDIEISGEAFTNGKSGNMTLSVPKLNDEALELDMEDYNIPTKPVSSAVPEEKLANRVTGDLVEAFFSCIDNVERGKSDYTVNGKKTVATCFKTELDEDTLIDALLEVAEKAKDDKELEEYFDEMLFGFVDADVDFDEMMDSIIDDLKDAEGDEDVEITVYTYINAKGDIIAIEMEYTDSYGDILLMFGTYTEGREVGFEFSVTDRENDEVEVALYGEGKTKWGKLDITFTAEENEEKIVSFKISELKLFGLKRGKFSGKLIFDESSLSENEDVPEILEGFSLEIEFNVKPKKYEYVCKLTSDEGELFDATLSGSIKRAKKIELHADANDDIEDWADDCDEDVLEDLEEAFTVNRRMGTAKAVAYPN